MKQLKKVILLLFLIPGFSFLNANPLDPAGSGVITSHDQFNRVVEAYQNEDWSKLDFRCRVLLKDFPNTIFAKEMHFYRGVALYNKGKYEKANQAFSLYLQEEVTPKFFNETLNYKFRIACAFQEGVRRNLFHLSVMPKWVHGYDEALALFDEVITTVPRDEMAAESLYRKSVLLLQMGSYKESVESFQTLIRRFPKSPFAPESYLGIADVYLTQSKKKFPHIQHLESAEINLRKFRSHFPGEPRIEEAEKMLLSMKNVMADDLFEIGVYYQKMKKPKAAAIYYQTILKKYSDTHVAKQAKKQLKKLDLPETFSEIKTKSLDNKNQTDALIVHDDPTAN